MSTTLTPRTISLDVVSDVVCPWCYIGSRRVMRALELVPDLDVRVNWRPFQLDPTIPAGGVDRTAYMLQKFGDQARIDAAHERLVSQGEEEGIAFHFERITRTPNTLDAHRIIRWAQSNGTQSAVADRLFALYFSEGADIGDHAVLQEVATQAGLDGEAVANRLAGDWDKKEVSEEIAVASRLGITGVPFFIIDGRYGIAGAQSAQALADVLLQAANEPATDEAPAGNGSTDA